MKRREFAITIGACAAGVVGCKPTAQLVEESTEKVTDAAQNAVETVDASAKEIVEDLDTETIETTKAVLYGFMITSFVLGAGVKFLPDPAVRILSVALIVSNKGAELAIGYLSEELERRQHRESLTEDQTRALESVGEVTFKLDNGEEETVRLSPTIYG